MAITVTTPEGTQDHPDGVYFRVDPHSGTLAVLAQDATVAVYAPGQWASAQRTETAPA